MNGTVTDFLLTFWLVLLVALIWVFLRYTYRQYNAASLPELYWKLSASIAMAVYDLGNLVLIAWFWYKLHSPGPLFTNSPVESRIISWGAFISLVGLFCKIRVFSDNDKEAFIVLISALVLSILSFVGYP